MATNAGYTTKIVTRGIAEAIVHGINTLLNRIIKQSITCLTMVMGQ